MKTTRMLLVLGVVLAGVLAAEPAAAWGRHGGVRVGFYVGAPFFPYYYPPYAYPPYYYPPYYPGSVVIQQQPSVYLEQSQQQPAPAASQPQMQGYWYYCAGSGGYYPYVRECPGGWQRVAPQPG